MFIDVSDERDVSERYANHHQYGISILSQYHQSQPTEPAHPRRRLVKSAKEAPFIIVKWVFEVLSTVCIILSVII